MEVLLRIVVMLIFLLVVLGAAFAIAKSLFSSKSGGIQTNKPTALPQELENGLILGGRRLDKQF